MTSVAVRESLLRSERGAIEHREWSAQAEQNFFEKTRLMGLALQATAAPNRARDADFSCRFTGRFRLVI